MARCSSSHVRTGCRASGTIAQVRIRPSLDVAINPASSSTERCRITVGSRSPVGPAKSVTRAGARARRVKIDRRVGSASAWKMSDSSGSCLAMSLTIARSARRASENFVKWLSFFPGRLKRVARSPIQATRVRYLLLAASSRSRPDPVGCDILSAAGALGFCPFASCVGASSRSVSAIEFPLFLR